MKDNCKRIQELLSAQAMEFALDEMAAKIAKMHPSAENLIVLGMASRGIPLAKKLSERLSQKFGKPIETDQLSREELKGIGAKCRQIVQEMVIRNHKDEI